MSLREYRTSRLLAAVAVLALAFIAAITAGPAGAPRVAAGEPPKNAPPAKPALPALEVDDDAPRLSDAPAQPVKPVKPVDPAVVAADNSACQVCHTNYRKESLAVSHAAHGVGCVRCHGASEAHRNDENNITPPDTMFPLTGLDEACKKCHKRHNVPARTVVARFLEKKVAADALERMVCTECHGEHRLAHRTVVWDRATGKLVARTPTPATAPPAATPAPAAPR